MNVLIVEPDHIMAQSARMMLEGHGYSVVAAHTGQEAIDVLDESVDPFAAVVIEPQLGIHNGIEFLYEMRSYHEWQHIPVVMWTMNQRLKRVTYRRALTQLGVRDVLYKPGTSLQKLVHAVSEVITV